MSRKRPSLNSSALFVALTVIASLLGCGGNGSGGMESTGTVVFDDVPPSSADISLLFMGNSHTTVNDVPGMIAAMMRAARPGKTVAAVVAPGSMFLEERFHDAASMNLLRSQRWSAVVLQAQKYSSSGLYTYSTAEAGEIIKITRLVGGLPIMFPEWPRRNIDETQRIYDLHVSIAQKDPACVAPIPQAWDLALARNPALILHASDGNHSAPAGAFLAALVLFATMSNESPLNAPTLQIDVDPATQAFLREIAAETVQTIPPRQWCASDLPI